MEKEKLTEIGLPETVKLFVRPNLSPYNEEISFNCRELTRKGHIYRTWFYSGSVFTNLNQLPRLFLDFKFGNKQG